MKKLLVIADMKGWVFQKIYEYLKEYCSDWYVDVWYRFEKEQQNTNADSHKNFDFVLYLCDFDLEYLIYKKIPKEKVILAIRSNVTLPFYDDYEKVRNLAGSIAVSNNFLYDRFSRIHGNVFKFYGGVDTDIYKYKEKKLTRKPVLGWAGSKDNFGPSYRGLDIINDACKKMGLVFNPALREVKMRNQSEMVKYYHDEIDIYVDMSISAGRQNGILEAGCCGVPVISSKAGISEELIKSGINGVIVNRNSDELVKAIQLVTKNYNLMSKNMRLVIEQDWNWKNWCEYFQRILNNLYFENYIVNKTR